MKKIADLKSLISALLLFTTLQLYSQNYSGIQNKTLVRSDEMSNVVGNALNTLFSPKLKGSIDSVKVLWDSEQELHLRIFFNGFVNGFLKINPIDNQKQTQQDKINPALVDLTGLKSPVDCKLTIKDNYPKGQLLESPFLKIEGCKDSKTVSGMETRYILNKKWKVDIEAQNLILKIKPTPVGEAARLSNTTVRDVLPEKKVIFAASKYSQINTVARPQVQNAPDALKERPGGVMRPQETSPNKQRLNVSKDNASRARMLKDLATAPASQGNPNDVSPKGPANDPWVLWTEVRSTVDIESQDISNIQLTVYHDINPKSNTFYFIPEDYHLEWTSRTDPEKGYGFSILYGTLNQPADAAASPEAPVNMSARLSNGISSNEVDFIRALITATFPAIKNPTLKPLPLKDKPEFSFASSLTSQYAIPAEQIKVTGSSNILDDISVSWSTNSDTKEFIMTALNSREGLTANVNLKPDADDFSDQLLPVSISFADPRSLGKIVMSKNNWRSQPWRNETPFPLQLNYLRILKAPQDNTGDMTPIIYNWSLNKTEVPAKSQVEFDASLVPGWLDNASALMWIDYSVVECPQCFQKITDALTGGVSGSKMQMVKFVIPPSVFDTLKADYFMIYIRSVQVDPKGEVLKELPASLKVTKDPDKEFTTGPLYIPVNGNIRFEYKITLATSDGDFVKSEEWNPSEEKEVLLGKSALKRLFPDVK